MAIGKLWQWFGTGRGMAVLVIQLVLVIVFIALYSGYRSSDRCVRCHADEALMTSLGYPQFVMTREQVQKEARHPNTECRDCHLGNGLSKVPDTAHKGMLRLLVLDYDFNRIERKGLVRQLLPTGEERQYSLLPKLPDGELNYDVGTVLYHDRDPVTYGYDHRLAEKTCGKSACHPEEVKQFSTSIMGSNFRQRSMRKWMDTRGPNN